MNMLHYTLPWWCTGVHILFHLASSAVLGICIYLVSKYIAVVVYLIFCVRNLVKTEILKDTFHLYYNSAWFYMLICIRFGHSWFNFRLQYMWFFVISLYFLLVLLRRGKFHRCIRSIFKVCLLSIIISVMLMSPSLTPLILLSLSVLTFSVILILSIYVHFVHSYLACMHLF